MSRKEEYERRKATQESYREQRRRDSWSSRVTDPNFIIQTLLVVCTGGLIVVGYLQYQTLEKTDRTLRLEQRALLFPSLIIPPTNFIQKIVADTELAMSFENAGKVPAFKTTELIAPVLFKWADFRDKKAMDGYWSKATGGAACKDLPLNPQGRAIYPGTHPAVIFPIPKDEVAMVTPPFAPLGILMAGCLIYESLGERHWTSVCVALEPIHPTDITYRSTDCFFHTESD